MDLSNSRQYWPDDAKDAYAERAAILEADAADLYPDRASAESAAERIVRKQWDERI